MDCFSEKRLDLLFVPKSWWELPLPMCQPPIQEYFLLLWWSPVMPFKPPPLLPVIASLD